MMPSLVSLFLEDNVIDDCGYRMIDNAYLTALTNGATSVRDIARWRVCGSCLLRTFHKWSL